MNGKQFEKLFIDSCKHYKLDCIRLKDAGWQGEETARRFTSKNICDFIAFNGSKLYKCELKKRDSSLRFDELTQLEALEKEYRKTESIGLSRFVSEIFICYFEKVDKCFAIEVMMIEQLKADISKKSFNAKDLELFSEEHPCFCYELKFEVPARKRKALIRLSDLE